MLEIVADEPFPSYAMGDVPSTPLELNLNTEHTWTSVETDLGAAELDGTQVTLTLPALDTAGFLVVRLVVTDGTAREAVEPLRLVVEDPMTQWLTMGEARREWADAPPSDLDMFEILEASRTACETFVRTLDGMIPDVIPADYRKAQRLQAVAIWTASRATNNNQMGGEGYTVTVFPLDWTVKQLLRPKSAFGGMW